MSRIRHPPFYLANSPLRLGTVFAHSPGGIYGRLEDMKGKAWYAEPTTCPLDLSRSECKLGSSARCGGGNVSLLGWRP